MAGGRARVETVDGPKDITIRPGTQGGAKYRLRGLGLRLPDGSRGDHISEVKVEIPEASTPAQKRAVKEFAEELNIEFDLDV
jgi:molecular chaperone DnaJ